MRRRTFIAGLGAVAWPMAAWAQQAAMPVIGYLGTQSADIDYENVTVPFLQGLKEIGYVDGQNVSIEYRWAENQPDRLRALAAKTAPRPYPLSLALAVTRLHWVLSPASIGPAQTLPALPI